MGLMRESSSVACIVLAAFTAMVHILMQLGALLWVRLGGAPLSTALCRDRLLRKARCRGSWIHWIMDAPVGWVTWHKLG